MFARAASFVASCGNLGRNFSGRNQVFRDRNAIVWQKDDFQPATHGWIPVDRSRQIIDELDGEFGHPVGGRSLARKQKCTRRDRKIWISPEAVV